MKAKSLELTFTLLITTLLSINSIAQDTTRILSHDHIKMVTDPSKGENRYPATVNFPKTDVQFRKINLLVTFQCPDGMQCGEWDYIDYINLKTKDPATGKDVDYEIARLITPYGRFFGTKWSFTFKADISEFSSMLRNQATIEYVHTGYESNTTCGWKITVNFEFVGGPPVARILAVLPMWNGSFPYGDSTNDIEKYLDAKKITATEKTGLMRLRILQTGHGMDGQDNCAEFCSKYREVIFDNQVIEHREIWTECATNPVYPQAGTWIYDRANWCPGCMVNPENYNFFVKPGSTHEINVDMQPYKVTKGKPSANYVFSSFLVMYEKPMATNDAAIEAIIAPSADDNFSRMNPVSCQPRILVKNNGIETLKSLKVEYGLAGQKPMVFTWTGQLEFGKITEIMLPGILQTAKSQDLFTAMLSKPNNRTDEYAGDNRMTSVMIAPPVYPDKFLLVCKTNKDTAQTAWKITDAAGKVWIQKKEADFKVSTEYRDTISLPKGQYELLVTDKEGDGLEFWANPRGGMGYVKLVSADGKLIRTFGSDFGNEIRQTFTVDSQKPLTAFQDAMVLVYPHRPTQNTTLMLFFNQPQTVKARLTAADGKLLQEMTW
ncbi:MAG: peptide-N-glycosidase F-related protein, partial [Bacteroidia bacterium]|nr:peptide-N-glycosidase F-related protein [Bacteroidia bacterium]